MRIIRNLIFLFFTLFFFNLAHAKTDDLELRMRTLEKKIKYLDVEQKEGKGRVDSFIAEKISLGGFFEHAITGNFSSAHDAQISANSNIFGLNFGAALNERFRLVAQQLTVLIFPLLNEHDATLRSYSNTPAVAALVAHAYGEYTHNEKFKIQMGLGWVPFGIALASREFPLELRRNGPQIASASLSAPYAIWSGLHILGETNTAMGTMGYNLYTATPTTDANMLGGGGRLWWESSRQHVKLGLSSQILDRGTDTVINVGGDVQLKVKPFGLKAEYAQSIADGEDIWTVYAQPYVASTNGKWVLHADVDYANRPLHFTETTGTAFEKWELGGGINFLPWPFVRTRLLFLYNDYVNASATSGGVTNDYYTIEYSTGIEF